MDVDTPQTTKWTIAISLLTILGAVCAAFLTYYASSLATKQSAIESCVNRIDKQEGLIREKAESVLASIAAFGSKTQAPDGDEKKFHTLGQDLVESAIRLTAYAPKELAGPTYHLMAVVQLALMAQTNAEKATALRLIPDATKDWPKQYYDLMDKYEQRRAACLE
ncbi:hypothetical protein ABRY74_12080 [Pseudomonas guariconensis]|uniref:hypothetical protein n=1 Tax=Pseudomonas guariconensis TaxID=1288410 RepID=UPI003EE32959